MKVRRQRGDRGSEDGERSISRLDRCTNDADYVSLTQYGMVSDEGLATTPRIDNDLHIFSVDAQVVVDEIL